jgi:hypothetical protein
LNNLDEKANKANTVRIPEIQPQKKIEKRVAKLIPKIAIIKSSQVN